MGKRTKDPEGEAPRMRLPSSGLAADILGTPGGAPPVEAPAGRERLFSFADGLERAEAAVQRPDLELETWVTFQLAGETFAFPVTHIQEILEAESITRVPHAPRPVRGVTNMRGRILPVVDLRVRLGLPPLEGQGPYPILVAQSRGRLFGLLVDGVRQVIRLDPGETQPPPPDVMTERSDYILGVHRLGDDLVILLDVDRVLLVQES